MEQLSLDAINRELINLKKEIAEMRILISEGQQFKDELCAWETASIEDLENFEKQI